MKNYRTKLVMLDSLETKNVPLLLPSMIMNIYVDKILYTYTQTIYIYIYIICIHVSCIGSHSFLGSQHIKNDYYWTLNIFSYVAFRRSNLCVQIIKIWLGRIMMKTQTKKYYYLLQWVQNIIIHTYIYMFVYARYRYLSQYHPKLTKISSYYSNKYYNLIFI